MASDCAPLLVAVSVYCSVSPGLALTAVAAGPPWVRLLTSLASDSVPGAPTLVTSLAVSVAASAGLALVYTKAALSDTLLCAPAAAPEGTSTLTIRHTFCPALTVREPPICGSPLSRTPLQLLS